MNQYNAWNDKKLNRIKEMRLNIKYGESNESSSSIPLPPSLSKSKSSLTRSTQMKEMESIRRVENSLKKKNFLISVVHEIMNAVSKYTTHCIMCGVPLEYPGAKPAICDKAICMYIITRIFFIFHNTNTISKTSTQARTNSTQWVWVWTSDALWRNNPIS